MVTIVTYHLIVKALFYLDMRDKTPDIITEKLIENLIAIRKEQGLSHDAVSKLTGLNRSTISLIESKKRSPTLKNCIKISNALGYKLSELLKKSESENS